MNDSTGLANKLELNDYYGDYGVREISIFNRKKVRKLPISSQIQLKSSS